MASRKAPPPLSLIGAVPTSPTGTSPRSLQASSAADGQDGSGYSIDDTGTDFSSSARDLSSRPSSATGSLRSYDAAGSKAAVALQDAALTGARDT